MLKGISKLNGYDGGEIIKFSSYTGFDQRTVLIDGHLNNPVEITGYLRLPEGTGKVPIVIYTHSSGDQEIMFGMISCIMPHKIF